MQRSSVFLLLRLALVAGLIVGPVVFATHQQKQMKKFRVVREGVLYRSGQMTLEGLERAVHDYGVRTVVSLRDARIPGEPPPDGAEEDFCRKLDIFHVRVSPSRWEGAQGKPAPVEKGVRRFLEVMADRANYPVLIHCFAGTHRTGGYCAIYRMEFENWSNERAIEELKSLGYANLEEEKDIFGYLSAYERGRLTLKGRR
jgi:tyrosine-protein phosphatase SIW14